MFILEISVNENGIEKIVEIDLVDAEKSKLVESAEGVKATNALLNEIGVL